MTKPKLERIITPKGVAAWAWCKEPDVKFNPENPDYKITVVLDDNKESRAMCDDIIAKGKAHAVADGVKLKKVFKLPFDLPEDDDTDDEDFKEEFKGKIRLTGKSKYKPKQIDAAMRPLTEDIYVMSGDAVKVRFAVKSYDGFGGGITVKLDLIQLLEKNAAQSMNTDGFGVEEGFTQSLPEELPADEEADEEDF